MAAILSAIKSVASPILSPQADANADADERTRSPPPTNPPGPESAKTITAGPRLSKSPPPVDANGTCNPALNTASSSTAAPSHKKTASSRLSRGFSSSSPKEKDKDAKNTGPVDRNETNITGSGVAAGAAQATAQATSVAGNATTGATDPLSQHIFSRTNTDHSIPTRLRNSSQRPESPPHDGLPPQASELLVKHSAFTGDVSRDKKKGVSFLSRLSMRGGKKKDAGADFDSDSELGSEARTDGANARVFSQAIAAPGAGGGYIPRHKEPPRYIKTKVYNKKVREFNRMFLAQELVGTRAPPDPTNANEEPTVDSKSSATPATVASSAARASRGKRADKPGGAIWATEFSQDGRYLAAAGRDGVVRVWAVISTHEERRTRYHEEEEFATGGDGTGERLSAPVFRERPVREFKGHAGEVLDLSWSKNNFLLSSSMDKTVRLWHFSRKECLCTFAHKDLVTKLAFHPRDDRFFLAGSLDAVLRLWSIPDKAVAFSAQVPDLITAVAFSPDGKTAIAGVLSGLCLFYETEGLKLQTQVHVRSSRGKNARGSKITGISTMAVISRTTTPNSTQDPIDGEATTGEVKVLITSNDSRIRVYNMRDKALEAKFKGHENACSQIAASFSDDGKYVICGSEDRKAFVWSLATANSENKDKKPCESFNAHADMVTTARFAPTQTRMLLGASGDPIYDLCNPPPVCLMTLEEAATASQTALSVAVEGDGASVPVEPTAPLSGHPNAAKKPEESPAYLARSTHPDGNIIVTSDDKGIIKVFRQDCAFLKRKQDTWETGSAFGKKLVGHGSGFVSGSVSGPDLSLSHGALIGLGIGRSASILSRNSASSAAHSRRGSVSQHAAGASKLASPPSTAGGIPPSSSDHILSWRQGIEPGSERRTSSIVSSSVGGTGTPPARSERSVSPSKASRTPLGRSSGANLASEARKQPYAGSPSMRTANGSVTSPTSSIFAASVRGSADWPSTKRAKSRDRKSKEKEKERERERERERATRTLPPTPSFSFRPAHESDGGEDEEDNLRLDPAGASYSFWNLGRWRSMRAGQAQGQSSGHTRSTSDGSPNLSGGKSTRTHGEVATDGERDESTEKERTKPRRKSFGATAGQPRKSSSTISHSGSNSVREDVPPVPRVPSNYVTPNRLPPPLPVQLVRDLSLSPPPSLSEAGRRHSSTGHSVVSKLSSEIDCEEEAAARKAAVEEDDEEEEMRCPKCGGTDFKASRGAKGQRLSCGKCGMEIH